ncbi:MULTISPECIES: isoleucine--tRNA ligase [Flavobacteriaceae]|uniref:Isoleucine--tRNA ligase n=2 Tax=Flavobacteriaceae TaxID=49546 RepID=A0A4Y8ARE6_9FLAO|nr:MULTISPECIES: isoleucine--tRNA ligase [Flavobacteriaceae]TEW72607.1 isoleucine--tRNA ligase [Gramella jeungdoensis]GGK54372.1 isoleucine--tRNA ligase [Lutibacter litoralis]
MSKKFREYKGLNLTKVADETLAFWEKEDIFEKSIATRSENKPFVFFEGPPSANGLPGIHHVMARAIKDIFCRYKTLQGFQVKRKAGWDTHGLPIELGVEKELGITKEDIGKKITIEEYNEACKKAVMRYTDVWNDLTKRVGYWVDMEDPYVTYKPKYMETVWWLLAEMYKKGLIYKGYTIQPYSPKAGTGLSSHELNQPGTYQDVTDTTAVAQFKAVKNTLPEMLQNIEGDVHFLAWTTTPWTLPSNTALTVGKKIDYVLVKSFNQYTFEPINVILAKNLVGKQFTKKFFVVESEAQLLEYKENDKKIPYIIVNEFKGTDILEAKYEQLLPYALPYKNPENAFRVIAGDFVTTEDGTGIVHTAPTFGADDALVAKQASPEVPPMLVLDDNGNPVPLVDLQGRFTKHMGEFAGKYVKNEYYNEGEAPERSLDVDLAIKLKEENKAFHVEKYRHSYPHCWRTDKPILYYPLDSWFIKVTDKRDRMFELNNTINWKPKSTGEGRFGNWLKNANDWNLSRSRYWGIPLPIWRTEDGTEEIMIGSVEELKAEMKKSVEAGLLKTDIFDDFEVGNMSEENYDKIDLHKNVVDAITLVSPKGQPMKRESDLIDVWFDSGSMPYAQWHYPFENKELIDNKEFFPADFIAEGVDQTRGWFYTLHAIGTMVFDSVAYKNVVSNGLVLDKEGKKMSKRLGNAIDPFETMDKYGADATRWYMISNANPWDNLKFDIEGIDEVRRKFFGTLYNTYSFFSLYANLDNFTYAEDEIAIENRPEIDRWILSELNTLIKNVEKFYEEYEPTKAARTIQEFVGENLSNWFVRLSRRRFWKGDYGQDKISAYQTLYTCLLNVAKLASPIAPFFMDNLYKDLISVTGKEDFESIHLGEFPSFDVSLMDAKLEHKMQQAQKISSMVLSLRKKEMIKVRQPLQRIMIPVLDEADREEILAVQNLIISEVNVKEIELIDDASGMLVKTIKPNFKVLGPKFGKEMRFVGQAIQKLTQEDIATIEKQGEITLNINEKIVNLTIDEVEITSQDIEGWLVANQGGLTVALDVTITDELRNEGNARELINRVQNLRKESGLEVNDKIKLIIQKNDILERSIEANQDYVKTETLTSELVFEEIVEKGTEIAFDDVNTKILIQKM